MPPQLRAGKEHQRGCPTLAVEPQRAYGTTKQVRRNRGAPVQGGEEGQGAFNIWLSRLFPLRGTLPRAPLPLPQHHGPREALLAALSEMPSLAEPQHRSAPPKATASISALICSLLVSVGEHKVHTEASLDGFLFSSPPYPQQLEFCLAYRKHLGQIC